MLNLEIMSDDERLSRRYSDSDLSNLRSRTSDDGLADIRYELEKEALCFSCKKKLVEGEYSGQVLTDAFEFYLDTVNKCDTCRDKENREGAMVVGGLLLFVLMMWGLVAWMSA